MSDEPFGRQPLPVKVTLEGDQRDVDYWLRILKHMAERGNADTQIGGPNHFTIYPRAVND